MPLQPFRVPLACRDLCCPTTPRRDSPHHAGVVSTDATSALMYSLLDSAELAGVNPKVYLSAAVDVALSGVVDRNRYTDPISRAHEGDGMADACAGSSQNSIVVGSLRSWIAAESRLGELLVGSG